MLRSKIWPQIDRPCTRAHWPFAKQADASNRFTILIATIDGDDANHTYTRAVARAFFKRDDIDRIETCRVLSLSDAGRDGEAAALAKARRWLAQRHADLLIGGELLKKDEAVSLWFIDKDPMHDWRASTFRLDANLLKQDFAEAASTQLLAVALSSIKPATDESGKYLVTVLQPIAERLGNLLNSPTGFSAKQRGDLQSALGMTLYVIGDQSGDDAALNDAVAADRAALQARTRDRAPLDWAATQSNLGIALATLGERESGTAHLKEAVTAFRAALEEETRERAPLDRAATQMDLGTALTTLGERESGTAHLEEAVAVYRAALQEFTRDQAPLRWASIQTNLGMTLVMLGEGESGTAHLEEAVAACRAALQEFIRDRAPLDWAKAQTILGIALVTLGERENGTVHLEEAVAAYQAALQEFTRDRAPLDWAAAQNNLGEAFMTLGKRENGTAHLEMAVAAYQAALQERTHDRAPIDWAITQYHLGIALKTLGERESGSAHLKEAVAAFEASLTVVETSWPSEWVQQVQSCRDKAQAEIARRQIRK